MTTSSAIHHRINEKLQAYWNEIRADRPMPMESDVNMDTLKDIWDYCFLVNVHGGNFAYSYLGSQLIEAYGDDFTGREITQALVYPHPTSLFTTFQEVVKTAQPKMDDSEFVNSRGENIKYRSCVLPLAAFGFPSVAFLLGGMKWKVY